MSLLPRCICDPVKALSGDYDPRCSRHLGVPRSPLSGPRCQLCKDTGVAFLDDPWGGVTGTCPDCHGVGYTESPEGFWKVDIVPPPPGEKRPARTARVHHDELSDARIIDRAHRLAFRFKVLDPEHGCSTYLFNESTLLQFARSLLAAVADSPPASSALASGAPTVNARRARPHEARPDEQEGARSPSQVPQGQDSGAETSEGGDAIPEGCTPADAQMLRAANHSLVDEIDRLKRALRPFAELARPTLSSATVTYRVERDPERQTFQTPSIHRAFNRAALALAADYIDPEIHLKSHE